MIRNRTKSKYYRPSLGKLQIIYNKRTQPMKTLQKLGHQLIRPLSQDFHTSLNQNPLYKNYEIHRSNSSTEKKSYRAKRSMKSNSNDLFVNYLQAKQQFQSKQKSINRNLKEIKEKEQRKNINQNKQRQEKENTLTKNANKQKQKQFKQQKQLKNSKFSFKQLIGSKLAKKLQNYLLSINLMNCMMNIKPKAPQARRYTVYVGKGNNSRLVRKLFSNRFWWDVVTKNDRYKEINLVWSQWSKQKIFNSIPTIKKQQNRQNKCNDQSKTQQQTRLASKKHIHSKHKQSFLKKLSPLALQQIKHIFDLFSCHQRKMLSRKALGRNEDIKQMVLDESRKVYRKMNVRVSHNHVQNHQQFTNKKNLFNNLKEHYNDEVFSIVPLTYHVISLQEEQTKSQSSLCQVLRKMSEYMRSKQERKQKEKSLLWIVKPGENSNRGCGIQVFKKLQQIKSHIQKQKEKHPQRTFIIQKYLNPFLYHRRKFDIRCYLLLTATSSLRAYTYPTGYIRTSSYEFSTKNCSNKLIHLTNDAIQKKNQEYGKYEKGNKVTYQEFQQYLDLFQAKKQLNFSKQIIPQMQEIMLKTVKAMTSKNNAKERKLNPNNRQHSFEIYGYDFMIDENFIPWLIEINTNPCIQTGCEILQEIIPFMLQNALKICVDTVFPPPKLQDWPLNELLTCPSTLFQRNQFQLIYNQQENSSY